MAIEQLTTLWTWMVPLIPALPILAFFIGIFGGGTFLHKKTPIVTISAMVGCVVISWGFILLPILGHYVSGLAHGHPEEVVWSQSWTWIFAGAAPVKVGVMVDHLTAAMLGMVSLVVLCIEVYSVGYMDGDPHFARFHSYVSLFAGGMLGLVVSNNFFTLLVSWEIMGLCSYLLIGFWYHKDSARKAAKKAFMVTRLGDCGMIIAIVIAYAMSGSFEFDTIFKWAATAPALLVCIVALGLFMGSIGKSSQFPLHVWLPDAMEGPTPVSALIHAATMVSAGVYLVARSYPLFYGAHGSLEAEFKVIQHFGSFEWARAYLLDPMLTVAWIGGFTALFAATMAVFAADIKKVLAYSTISQLGYMFLALGVGGYTAGVFHLLTHAFFKALLFLGSGSVIHAVEHAMHHEHVHEDPQNMYNMGGLFPKMKTTAITFLIGTVALAGLPPFAGFFSKDEILLEALYGEHPHRILFAMGVLAAFLTAFYMARLCMLTFFGKPRFPKVWEHTHDSPKTMTMPLVVLAVFAAILGLPAAPALWGGTNYFHHFINLEALEVYGVHAPHAVAPSLPLAGFAVLVALAGIAAGYALYGTRDGLWVRRFMWGFKPAAALMMLPKKLYYMNEILYAIFAAPTLAIARGSAKVDQYVIDWTVNLVGWLTLVASNFWQWFDQTIIDKIGVNGPGWLSKNAAEVGKFAQSGKVQGYALFATVGLLLLVVVRVLLVR